jgi:small multidrug resistance pump
MQTILLIIYILSTSSGLILLKLGSSSGAPFSIVDHALKLNLNPLNVLGILLYGISFLLYTYLLSKFDIGFIVPLTTAVVYVIIMTASFLLFKEVFTPLKVVAITLIVIGVILLNLHK